MTRSKKTWGIVGVLLILLALIIYFVTKLPTFDTEPLSNSVSATLSDYSALAVNTDELGIANEQLGLLMQKPKYENEDSIKAILVKADSIINRIDLADPTVQVSEDKEKATTALTEVQKALDLAMSHYSLEKAEVTVERIDLGVLAQGGTVGDTLSITPQVYPTFTKEAVLDWVSSDEAVAIVNENGDISLVGAGTATVTVTENRSGTTSSVEITVSAPEVKPPVTEVVQPTKPTTPAPSQGSQGGTGTPTTPTTPSQGGTGTQNGQPRPDNWQELHEKALEYGVDNGDGTHSFWSENTDAVQDGMGMEDFNTWVGGLKPSGKGPVVRSAD